MNLKKLITLIRPFEREFKMVYKLLELIMSDQVHTEDMLMEKLNIDEEKTGRTSFGT